MSRTWAGGSTRAWRRLRHRILARDGWRCRLQLPGVCAERADCVHHVHGRAVTGDDPQYLIAACTPCNRKVGDPRRAPDPPGKAMTRW